MTEEELLPGGNATLGAVVRVGATVRKPWLAHTGEVHRYLERLRDRGVAVPEVFAPDDQGRQVLEFVVGDLALDRGPLPAEALRRVGGMVRSIHDASPKPDPRTDWDVLLPVANADLVCHNDLGPWNLIIGDRWLFIDWDGAGPSTRLWDLAYSAQAFAVLVEGQPVEAAALRLRAFVDGYAPPGIDDPVGARLRGGLADVLAPRTAAMYALLEASSRSGRQPWARMFHDGHGEHWGEAAAYVARNHAAWAEALGS